jgi:hypothetical protein
MALANAAAAAPTAEPPLLDAVEEGADDFVEQVLVVTLSRAADGSLGLSVGADDEGRVVVTAGRDAEEGMAVLAGDVITSLDGTEVPTVPRYEQELTHVYATGVNDMVRLKLLRPPAALSKPSNLCEAVAAEASLLRASLEMQTSHLEMLARHEEGLLAQEIELEQRLRALRVSREVSGLLREADEGAFAELQESAESLRVALSTTSVAAASTAEKSETAEITPLPTDEAASVEEAIDNIFVVVVVKAIALSKQRRAVAYQGRKHVRGRAYEEEERMMRAQVITFDPEGA